MALRRSLAQTIFFKHLTLAALPIIAIAMLIYMVLSADLEDRARRTNALLGESIGNQVDEFLEKPLLLLNSLDIQSHSFRAHGGQAQRLMMDELIERTGVFDVIYLVDADQRIAVVGLPQQRRNFRTDYEQVSTGGHPFIRQAQSSGQPQWSDTFLSVLSNSTSLGLALPLPGNEVLVGNLNINRLSEYVARLRVSQDELAMIVDKRGHIIAHPDLGVASQQLNISNQPLVRNALDGQQGTGELQLDGDTFIASTHLIADVGWVVITGEPRLIIQQDITNTMAVIAVGALLAIVMAAIVSRWVAQSLARPFVLFSEVTDRVKRGESKLEMPHSDIREVAWLSQNFEQMVRELREQQSSLRSSERKYRQLVDQVPCVICRVSLDPPGDVIYVGKPIEKISGYPASAFNASGPLTLDALIHPDDRERRATLLAQQIEQQRSWEVEYRLLHRDGSIRWILESGQASFDGNDQRHYCDLMLIDHTQRRLAERNQQEQAELLLTLVDTLPGPIFYQNRFGELQGCNSSFETFFGVEQHAIIGHSFAYLASRYPVLAVLGYAPDSLLQTAASDSREVSFEYHGRQRHIAVKRASFADTEGVVSGLVGAVYDLTERIEAEQQNQQLRRYYGNVIDAMPSVMIGISSDRQVVQMNREARHRLHQTGISDQADYATLLQRLGLDEQRIERAIQTQQPDQVRRQPRSRDNGFDDITLYPLDDSVGGGVVVRIDDVSDQVRMEELMVQSEKMLSVGGLAAGMAHEINNPLAGILQNAQVLGNRFKVDLPANKRAAEACDVSLAAVRCYLERRGVPEMLTAISDSGQRAARIVDNMLSFARKSDSDLVATDVAELLDQTVELTVNDYDLKKNYDFRDVELIRDYQTVPAIRCAPSKLQQVFFNLLKNSAQAMANSSSKGRRPQIALRIRQLGQRVRIEIADNGPGIPPREVKRVFEPFYTTKDVGVGTGLGLSVSYFIITENHNGTMWVESVAGAGARFCIELPIGEPGGGTNSDC